MVFKKLLTLNEISASFLCIILPYRNISSDLKDKVLQSMLVSQSCGCLSANQTGSWFQRYKAGVSQQDSSLIFPFTTFRATQMPANQLFNNVIFMVLWCGTYHSKTIQKSCTLWSVKISTNMSHHATLKSALLSWHKDSDCGSDVEWSCRRVVRCLECKSSFQVCWEVEAVNLKGVHTATQYFLDQSGLSTLTL